MPIYMDRHNTEGLTREDIVASHVKDLAIQGQIWRPFHNVLA